MKPEDLKVGQAWINSYKIVRTIMSIDNGYVFYCINSESTVYKKVINDFIYCFGDCVLLQSQQKPLDKAFKDMGETPLVKAACSHKNVKKESFFSARIYLTCQDCGKALN